MWLDQVRYYSSSNVASNVVVCDSLTIQLTCLSIDERIDWMTMQTLVRSMPDLHKTLILVNVKAICAPSNKISCADEVSNYKVEEVAIASEHAPFRHREVLKDIGAQRKRKLSS